MPTQKRRIIYLSDEVWEEVKRQTEGAMTISGYIRWLIEGREISILGRRKEQDDSYRPSIDTGKATQAQRDTILRRINKGE